MDLGLGSHPWDDEALRAAYWRSFTETRTAIKASPGGRAQEILDDLRLSFEVFGAAVDDLLSACEAYRVGLSDPRFFDRVNEAAQERAILAVRRGTFCAVASALALVDHSRRARDRWQLPGYRERVKAEFAQNPEHRFVQGLRNYVSHFRPSSSTWREVTTYGPAGKRETSFVLRAEELLAWDEWDPPAREYIRSAPKNVIDLESLFRGYRERVTQFQEWLRDLVESIARPELAQYRHYKAVVDQLASWSSWNLVIREFVLKRNLDPYTYLNRYLTPAQLEEVRALPSQSREQVDRIIELVDRHRACAYSHRGRSQGDELRMAVYRAFGVAPSEVSG